MQKRLYNLDGLRFLAALIVVICHLEVFKTMLGLEGNTWRFFTNSAQLAVSFFFVLSGFLITYLLLIEKKKDPSQRIGLLTFYKKRALRIWPLYYLLLLLTFFVLNRIALFTNGISNPEEALNTKRLLGYLFFLPNYAQLNYGGQPYLGQVWSLGVEEFFYLFFPIGIYFIRLQHIRKFLVFLFLLFLILSLGIHFIGTYSETSSGENFLPVYLDRYRIYSFAAGGFAASLLVLPMSKQVPGAALWRKKTTPLFLSAFLAVLVGAGITFSIATQQLYSLLFALFIYSCIVSEARLLLLNHPSIVYLGKISYGIYMLHPVAIVLVLKTMPGNQSSALFLYVVTPIAATVCSILLAALSYELFEKFFLRFARNKRSLP